MRQESGHLGDRQSELQLLGYTYAQAAFRAQEERIDALKAERDALREALHEIVDVLHAVKTGPRALDEAEMIALAALATQERPE